MIKNIILYNAIPITIIGYYISLLVSFSQTERMNIDLRPKIQQLLELIVKLSPLALTISVILGIMVMIARHTEWFLS